MRILAIDIGIRNLALCMLDNGRIAHWQTVDLSGSDYKPQDNVKLVMEFRNEFSYLFDAADLVIVERQMRVNMRIIEAVLHALSLKSARWSAPGLSSSTLASAGATTDKTRKRPWTTSKSCCPRARTTRHTRPSLQGQRSVTTLRTHTSWPSFFHSRRVAALRHDRRLSLLLPRLWHLECQRLVPLLRGGRPPVAAVHAGATQADVCPRVDLPVSLSA